MNRKEAEERAVHLVDQMTVEEMASQLRYDAPAIERLHIPAYNWWNEALHGVARAGTATVFPQAIALAAMFDDKKLKVEANTSIFSFFIFTHHEEITTRFSLYSRQRNRNLFFN